MNTAYLVANDSPRPAGPSIDGDFTYELKHVLADAKTTIPVLWASLFQENDIKAYKFDCELVPALVVSLSKARTRWNSRKNLLVETFPHNLKEIEDWGRALDLLSNRYIKIDAEELYALGEAEFETDLRFGIRWFDSHEQKDFDHLLGLNWLGQNYNRTTKIVEAEENVFWFFYGHAEKLPPIIPANSIYPQTRDEWRSWLEANQSDAFSIRLIYPKLETGEPRVSYRDALEEAIRFGWVDSGRATQLDHRRSCQWFRRADYFSAWRERHRRIAQAMIAAGEMTSTGRTRFESAVQDQASRKTELS